ncbi:hypothetical protein GCM10027059_32390 [Myceligenerans halotolerans]
MTERTTMTANAEDSYLRDVGKRLRALTPEQREAVLDDIRAHFADAADAGRTPEQAAVSLGDPATFTERVRAELGHDPGRADRIRRVLQWLATAVAVFTAMFVSFLWPDESLPGLDTQFEEYGFGIVLWNLIPALIAVLPILVPARARTLATASSAIALTVVSFTSVDSTFFVPTAMLAWAALVTPVIARNGRPAVGWRIAGGVLTALPGFWVLGGALTGTIDLTVESVLSVALIFALSTLIIRGKAWAGTILAVVAAATIVLVTLTPGLLLLAVWWSGGLLLTLGASHALAHARPREHARAQPAP